MKVIVALIFLVLTSCGGGGGISTPSFGSTVNAQEVVIRNGAWNSNRDYEYRYSILQADIDALGGKGELQLECGTYEGSVIYIPSFVLLRGRGRCTHIPSVKATPSSGDRSFEVGLENLLVDGSIDGYGNIGIDFENCTKCYVSNVDVEKADYGVFVYGQAYYNSFTNLHIRPRKSCYEIGGVANSNHIDKGSCLGVKGVTYGVVLSSVNNTSIEYTSFEHHKVGIDMSGTVNTTLIIGIRLESMNVGIDVSGSTKERIIGLHCSSVPEGCIQFND